MFMEKWQRCGTNGSGCGLRICSPSGGTLMGNHAEGTMHALLFQQHVYPGLGNPTTLLSQPSASRLNWNIWVWLCLAEGFILCVLFNLVSVCLSLSVSLSVYLSVHLPVCITACVTICWFVIWCVSVLLCMSLLCYFALFSNVLENFFYILLPKQSRK